MAGISAHEDGKLAIILNYNHNEGGLNKVTGAYSCRYDRPLAPLVILYNIIDMFSCEEVP